MYLFRRFITVVKSCCAFFVSPVPIPFLLYFFKDRELIKEELFQGMLPPAKPIVGYEIFMVATSLFLFYTVAFSFTKNGLIDFFCLGINFLFLCIEWGHTRLFTSPIVLKIRWRLFYSMLALEGIFILFTGYAFP